MSATNLDPVDPAVAPFLQAVGRVVLVAALFEQVLLVDIAERHVDRDGFAPGLGPQLSRLERRPAGELLGSLKALGIAPDLADRVQDVVDRRNRVIHHLTEDADVLMALTGADPQPAIARLDQLAADFQALITDIAPRAFSGIEGAFGTTLPDLFCTVGVMNLDTPDAHALPDDVRQRLRALHQAIDSADLASLFDPPPQ